MRPRSSTLDGNARAREEDVERDGAHDTNRMTCEERRGERASTIKVRIEMRAVSWGGGCGWFCAQVPATTPRLLLAEKVPFDASSISSAQQFCASPI